MSGSEEGRDTKSSGVRRRFSSSIEDIAESESTGGEGHGSRGHHGTSVEDHVDSKPAPDLPTEGIQPVSRKSESGQRVRFSTDIDRTLPTGSGGKDSHLHAVQGALPLVTGALPVRRTTAPELSIDTGGAVRTINGTGQGIRQMRSSGLSPTSAAAGPSFAPSQALATSPKTRNRGYSLRRSLFAKSIDDQVHGSNSNIELGSLPQGSDYSEPPKDRKKSTETQVTVSPIVDENGPIPAGKSLGPGKISSLPHYESFRKRKGKRSYVARQFRGAYEKARKRILRIEELSPSKDGRHIELDAARKNPLVDERRGGHYLDNTIRSCRYTLWNFFPRQLFAQFSKIANFYFLCVAILQMIPGLSTTGTYTTIVPLLFFVSLSMAKEGYDDFRRYRLDKAENNRDAQILHAYQPMHHSSDDEAEASLPVSGPNHWATIKWKDIKVGDIVRLARDEAVPADLVLIRADGPGGIAYIETMALDGETSLKTKRPSPLLAQNTKTLETLAAFRAHIVAEDPNLDLYAFEGRVSTTEETRPLTDNEVIYRGSVLRNTSEVIGMVVYTGEECKIRMNATKNPRVKAPALQSDVNRIVVIIVIFVILLAIFNSAAYEIWHETTEEKSWYLANATVSFFPILTSFIIMFNTMIPLSLYVSLEIVKLAQMFLMNDIDMYDPKSNTPMEARTSTINEDLGQVSYIFSDKTGTLTDNSMHFRKMSVAGTAWLHDTDLFGSAQEEPEINVSVTRKQKQKKRSKPKDKRHKTRAGRNTVSIDLGGLGNLEQSEPPSRQGSTYSRWKSSARPAKAQHELNTTEMLDYIQHKPLSAFARKARFFLLSIALCHTCLPEVRSNGEINYQSASPDELALVKAAQELGFIVIDRQAGTITLKTLLNGPDPETPDEVYEILDVLEFSSARKRMSIIVRFPNGRICLFCKGADSILMQRLRRAALAIEKAVEIERRVSVRRSMEVQEAIRRNGDRRNSQRISRKSSLNRQSMIISRPSMTHTRLQSVRDELDIWLRGRESVVDMSTADDDSILYSPRPSTQITGRPSFATTGARRSLFGDVDGELVEESLVLDDSAVFERTFQHINDFATEGLRTLLYGYKFLDEQDYMVWKKLYVDASTSLIERESRMEKIAEQVEQDLELAGATAIEDKLQHGVPEAIEKLSRAGIKLWMLTGDKRETAITIGHSCRLIKDYSSVTILDHETGQLEQHMAAAIIEVNHGQVAHAVVVVDGQTLGIIESDESLKALFFDLVLVVDSVVCCRASPSQKALLVRTIRTKVNKSVTLAIGDGANDIAMIQEAQVGIGITGKEGMQAARASDYSIAQFRFLLKLLLVHGRWNYIRICKYTLGTFWKEMLFYLTQALYQRWAGYTGTSLYESWSLTMFNTLFTSLPVIFMGIFEKDLSPSTLLAVPELYNIGQRRAAFNLKMYLTWVFLASSEAMLVYFCMLSLYGGGTADVSVYPLGVLTFSSCIILIATKMQLIEMHNKSIVVAISIFCSVGGWFLWNLILTYTYSTTSPIYYVRDAFVDGFGHTLSWWLVLLITITACFILEIFYRIVRSTYWPIDVDIFQEYEKDPIIRQRFEEAAYDQLQDPIAPFKDSDIELQSKIQAEREVAELLDRPRVMEEGRSQFGGIRRRHSGGDLSPDLEQSSPAEGSDDQPIQRQSLDIHEMLSRRFGSIRRE